MAFYAPANSVEAFADETVYGGFNANNIVAEVDMAANLRQTNIPVISGKMYWLSFRYSRRQDFGTPNPSRLFVKLYDATGSYIQDTVNAVNTVWDWQCKTYQFTATTNNVSIDLGTQSNITFGTLVDDITITPVAQPIAVSGAGCQGGTISLQAPDSVDNSSYSNYIWTGPNGFTSTGPHLILNNLQAAQTGDYTCTMHLNTCLTVSGTYHLNIIPSVLNITKEICAGEDYPFYGRFLYAPGQYDTVIAGVGGACDSTIRLNLIVNPLPDAGTYPNGYIHICKGDTVHLQARDQTAGTTYQWTNEIGTIYAATGNTYPVSEQSIYIVTVTSDKGCTATSPLIYVYINPLPTVSIKVNENGNPCISDTISLTAVSANAFGYNWYPQELFRQTNTNAQKDAEAVLSSSSSMIVLNILDSIGCRASDSVRINARACCRLFIPSAFTPNGDGTNDYFLPQINRNQVVVAAKIFDRWGKMVYSSASDISKKGWDGNYPDGKPALQGVYIYGIEYTCSDQSNQFAKGDVTLLR